MVLGNFLKNSFKKERNRVRFYTEYESDISLKK